MTQGAVEFFNVLGDMINDIFELETPLGISIGALVAAIAFILLAKVAFKHLFRG